jgi:hypothetical protein
LSEKDCVATVDFGGGVVGNLVRHLGGARVDVAQGKHRIRLGPFEYGWFRAAPIEENG